MLHNDLRNDSAPNCGTIPQGKGREGIGKEEEKNRLSFIASPRRDDRPQMDGGSAADSVVVS